MHISVACRTSLQVICVEAYLIMTYMFNWWLRQGQCKLLYHTLDCSDGNRFTYHTSHCIEHKDLDLARVDHFCHHELQPVESEIKRRGSTDHVVLHVTDF